MTEPIAPARSAFVADEDAPALVPDGISGHITPNPKDHPFFPSDESFDEEDYQEAAELQQVARELIARYDEFAFIRPPRHTVQIRVLWKRKGGKTKGKLTYGRCEKSSGLALYFSGEDFVIWIAADHGRDARLNNLQIEALLYHELCHISYTVDEKTGEMTYVAKGHDDEFFWNETRRYGAWNQQRAKSLEVWQQVPIGA